MEIKNYRCISEFNYQLKKINIVYGQNGVGKTTIKKVLNNRALGIAIPSDPNIDSKLPDSVTIADEVGGYTPLIFDEEYIKKYVFSNNSLREANKYDVLFSKSLLDDLKDNVRSIVGYAVTANQKLTEIVNKLQKPSQLINAHFSNSGIKPKLKNITKQSITGSNDMNLLSFARKSDDMYVWWRTGYQSFWNASEQKCIFCNQSIENSPIKDLLVSKQNETINAKTQIDFLKDIESSKDCFSEQYSQSIDSLKSTVIDSCASDVTIRLIEHKDAMLPIYHLTEKIIAKRDRISQYINKIELMNTEGLVISDSENILSQDLLQILNDYNELIGKIQKELDIYNKLLAENKRILVDMITGNEMKFNQILGMFGLSYKIGLSEDGLNLEKEQIDFKFNLQGKQTSVGIDIVDRSDEVLSFGEKNTIAFAFYVIDCVNKLSRRSEDSKYLIILDDPISSHDIFRKYSTVDVVNKYIISELLDKDIFILFTHEFELMVPLRETIIKSHTNSNFIGLKSKDGKLLPVNITASQLQNTIYRMIKSINSDVHPITKVSMLRVVREFDTTIMTISRNSDWLYSYLCDIVHFRDSGLSFREDEYHAFIDRYGVNDVLLRTFAEYSSLYSNINLENLTDIDKYFILRPYVEYLLSTESLKIDGFSYRSYSNSQLVAFIDSNFTFLNSSVHQNHNEDEPTFYDIKEFEMFSTSIFDKFIEAIK